MHHYKINLKPIAPFFFGKELGAALGNKKNYFQESSLFPQQTTLLGMLRHVLLLKNGIAVPAVRPAVPNEVANLIGDSGFKINQGNQLDYGNIEKISPLFMQADQKGHYFLYDKHWDDTADGYVIKPDRYLSSLEVIKGKEINHYSGKTTFGDWLYDINTANERVSLKCVLQSPLMTGNTKSWEGEADENSYYRHRYQSMGSYETIHNKEKLAFQRMDNSKADWSFCLYLEANTEVFTKDELSPKNRLVTMGKEQSMFQLTISPLAKEEQQIWNEISADNEDLTEDNQESEAHLRKNELEEKVIQESQTQGIKPNSMSQIYRITFLSDAYGDISNFSTENLSLIDAVRFKSFTTKYGEKQNYAKRPSWQKHACNLIKKGSVIYTKNPNQVKSEIYRHKEFRQVGYNYLQIEKHS